MKVFGYIIVIIIDLVCIWFNIWCGIHCLIDNHIGACAFSFTCAIFISIFLFTILNDIKEDNKK